MSTARSILVLATFTTLAACSSTDRPEGTSQEPPRPNEPDAPAVSSPPLEGPDAPAQPELPPGALPGSFDEDAARARAQTLIGLAESEIEPDRSLRIVRRGEESFPVTMDLRPGRMNVELDETGDGGYVVTRVVVETPQGANLVVE